MSNLTIKAYTGVGPVFEMRDIFDSNATISEQSASRIVYRNSANDGHTNTYNEFSVFGSFAYDAATDETTGTITGFELRSADLATVLASVTDLSMDYTKFAELLFAVGGTGTEQDFGSSLFANADAFTGGVFADDLASEGGDDVVLGLGGNDTLDAGDGDDAADGGLGNDSVDGGAGDDRLDGGDGRDTLEGNLGNDTLVAHGNGDLLDGGDDLDMVDYGGLTKALKLVIGDSLPGGAAGDTLVGIEGAFGTAFADTLTGDDRDNRLVGRGGNDLLAGGEGADTLTGGSPDGAPGSGGGDTLDGGAGEDVLDGSGTAYVFAYGGLGADVLVGGDGFSWLEGGEGADDITAGPGVAVASYLSSVGGLRLDLATPSASTGEASGDVFHGVTIFAMTQFDDVGVAAEAGSRIDGFGGNDVISGLAGDDLLFGYDGNDIASGGAGNDYLGGGGGNDALAGEDGDDGLIGQEGYDYLFGGAGQDNMQGGEDADVVLGGDGNDFLMGNEGADYVAGGAGSDFIIGGQFFGPLALGDVDTLDGGDGADYLYTGTNNGAVMYAGEGNDIGTSGVYGIESGIAVTFWGGAGADNFFGYAGGNDLVLGEDGDDNLYAFGGSDTVYGGGGNDFIAGDYGDAPTSDLDFLYGGAGNDGISTGNRGRAYIDGGEGNDNLTAGLQGDTLRGGTGSDYMVAGAGADRFWFAAGDCVAGEADTIADFQSGDHLTFDASYRGLVRVSAGDDGALVEVVGASGNWYCNLSGASPFVVGGLIEYS